MYQISQIFSNEPPKQYAVAHLIGLTKVVIMPSNNGFATEKDE